MFKFRRRRGNRRRAPITIGFEQLEVREMQASGLTLTIIPNDPRPLLSMPRPYVASFDPQAERPITVALTPRREAEERVGLWRLGGRFRFWTG